MEMGASWAHTKSWAPTKCPVQWSDGATQVLRPTLTMHPIVGRDQCPNYGLGSIEEEEEKAEKQDAEEYDEKDESKRMAQALSQESESIDSIDSIDSIVTVFWQWYDDDKLVWVDYDRDWNHIFAVRAAADDYTFHLTRRGGLDLYHIDLDNLKQTSQNKQEGGRTRCLRLVRLYVIRDTRGWHADPDHVMNLGDLSFQTEMNTGFQDMPASVTKQLLPVVMPKVLKREVTAQHECVNAWGQTVHTTYKFDLENMSQRLLGCKKSRPIRLVAVKILRTSR
jgi:hypothetical protein